MSCDLQLRALSAASLLGISPLVTRGHDCAFSPPDLKPNMPLSCCAITKRNAGELLCFVTPELIQRRIQNLLDNA